MAEPLPPPLRAILGPGRRWDRFEHRPEVTSTNDVVADAAREGARPGLVVATDRQTAGRGRQGRRWEDRRGRSLLVSALLAPPPAVTSVPLATGLAVAEAVDALGASPELKWPNDVLLDGRKCAGILAELVAAPGGPLLVVGLGVNVDWRDVPREEDGSGWVSVAEVLGAEVDRWELLAAVLQRLDGHLELLERDPAALRDRYRGRCATLGRDVVVELPAGPVAGRAVDVDVHGGLVVDRADGRGTVAVQAGDVHHVRPAPSDP